MFVKIGNWEHLQILAINCRPFSNGSIFLVTLHLYDFLVLFERFRWNLPEIRKYFDIIEQV
jgi:hypothetical protein